MANPNTPLAERLWSRVKKSDGCWPWQSWTRKGYGQILDNKRLRTVSRVAYELTYGPLPPGLTVDHLCRNTRCCRPDHLEAVTNRENVLRGIGITARNVKKTHCPRGHPYTPENTRICKKTHRQCRTCDRIHDKRRRAKAAALKEPAP